MKKIILLTLILLTCSCKEEINTTENTIKLKNNTFLFEEKVFLNDIIENEDIIFKNKELNTINIGLNTITLTYQKDKKTYAEKITYEVIDNTPPLVWLNSSYSVTVNSNIDLANAIICADNADAKPTCSIEGYYDLNKVGSYPLKHIAVDASGNKAEKNFTLYVKKKSSNESIPSNKRTLIEDVIAKYKNENTMIGIDVSKYQGDINWSEVKNAGIEFAMIRLGTQWYFDNEDYVIDPYFEKNIKAALEKDIKVGIYFYSYATSENEAVKQANYVIDKVKDYEITMPIAFDWEVFKHWNNLGISLYDLRQISSSYQDTLKENGYRPVQYGSKNYLNAFWLPVKYETWVAHYTNNQTDYTGEYIMWQLCSNGKVPGINGNVDIDVYYKS